MRTIIGGVVLAIAVAGSAAAQSHHVSGYMRANGTYVAPHESANPGSVPSSGFGFVNPENHQVSGYSNSSGTYVNPYRATNPNATRQDNYSTKGNVDPWTGKQGTKSPW